MAYKYHEQLHNMVKWSMVFIAFVVFLALIYQPIMHLIQSAKKDINPLELAFPMIDGDNEANITRMLAPRLQGVDSQGRPYNMTATTATKEGDHIIHLDTVDGKMVLGTESNGWYTLSADKGIFDSNSNILNLTGHVVVTTHTGYRMQTATAQVSFKNSEMQGSDPVTIDGPMGMLYAKGGFHSTDNNMNINFIGPVNLTID